MKRVHASAMLLGLLLPAVSLAAATNGPPAVRALPEPDTRGRMPLEKALAGRRSVRSFLDAALSEPELSQLLWAAQGITDPGRGGRTAPSAGATYPLETYVVVAEGVFRYLPAGHRLEVVKRGDMREALARAALGQPWVRFAPAVIAFSAVPGRTTGRYGARGMRYVHMEAGHAAQNAHLQAVALGLGSVPVGAFDDAAVAGALGLPEGETALYLIPVGRPVQPLGGGPR